MDILEVKRQAAARAQEVCEYLLPQGKRFKDEWEVGSIDGEPGKSLKVKLAGSKSGIWSDFATGDSGDMIDLWHKTRSGTLRDALEGLSEFLGIRHPEFTKPRERAFKRPQKPKCKKPEGKAWAYLTEDRNIPSEILEKYKIAEDGDFIVFPFLRDGELIMAKVREAVDGAKPKPTEAGCEKILFGWQAIDPNSRDLVITEGEIDALSAAAYGLNAVSVPFGGGDGNKQDWIESEYDSLLAYENIYLCMDMDEAGEKAVGEISKRLGRHRCRIVRLPRKDMNECLVDGVSESDIHEAVRLAETLDPESLASVRSFKEKVHGLIFPDEDDPQGYHMPYETIRKLLFFRPGETTIWSGSTGSGKSQIVSDGICDWVKQGARVCLASLEMVPQQSLRRMVKQTIGTGSPTESSFNASIEYLDAGVIIYSKVGKENISTMLEAFDYARAKYDCDTFIIDSLMRLGIESDDYSGQEKAMFQIVDWTIQTGVHTHLVAHSRKTDGKSVQSSEDVKGGMELAANAFNICAVWRDQKHEDLTAKQDRGEELSETEQAYLERGGVVLNVSKQRNGDWTGKTRLHFNLDCYQYRSNRDDKAPRVYIH